MSKKLIKVPYIDQTKEWPTGCESVSAVMLLQYLGMDISVEQFVDFYLEKTPLFEKDGTAETQEGFLSGIRLMISLWDVMHR